MKKGILTSLICLTSILFSSCGRTKVKVTLIGDEFIGWEKTTDIAKVNKDYYVKAISKVKGYTLYSKDLDIKIGGVPVYEGEELAYTYDEKSLTLKIREKAIIGDIEITGKGDLRESEITFIIKDASHTYTGITPESQISATIESEIKLDIIAGEDSYQPKTKDDIKISPSVNFTLEKDVNYILKIPKGEIYTDLVITLP